jgi:hypothetical protein
MNATPSPVLGGQIDVAPATFPTPYSVTIIYLM